MSSPSARRLVTTAAGASVLVADDHEQSRTLYVALLTQVDGVGDVVAVADGTAAVAAAQATPLDVAILDLNMPRLDGIGAAARIRALQPKAAIALHSSEADGLARRARGLGLPLFDKADVERLVAWVAAQAERLRTALPLAAASARDRSCASCGYGIVCAVLPSRCPMCGQTAGWTPAANPRARAER
jgi:CheY-like chemotaxis protein